MNSHNINAAWLEELTADINMEQTLQNFSTQIDSMLTNVASVLSSTVKGLITASFAFIIAVYISLDGKRVGRHATKLITAYLKPSWAEWILHVCRTFRRIFGNFLTGQCTETVILGFLMCITFSIFKLQFVNFRSGNISFALIKLSTRTTHRGTRLNKAQDIQCNAREV